MFERIVENAPAMLTAAHMRVLLRAIVHLDQYTFADDLAEEMADDNDPRSAEEVLLTVIDGTTDEKLIGLAVRLALSGHRGIPRENEPDFLTEASKAFAKPKKTNGNGKAKKPTLVKPAKAKSAKPHTSQSRPNPDGGSHHRSRLPFPALLT